MAWSEPLACAASFVLSRLQVLHRTLPLSARQKLGSIVLPFTPTLPLPWPEIAPAQPSPQACRRRPAKLLARVTPAVGRRRAPRHGLCERLPLGRGLAGGTRRGVRGGPPRRSFFVRTRGLPAADAEVGAVAGGGAAAR